MNLNRTATAPTTPTVRMSEVLSALSYILDVVEGQPRGHIVRSCYIGMTLGQRLGLSATQLSDLFYALLLKDAGCSSNAARVSAMFGADDFVPKHNMKTVNWSSLPHAGLFVLRNVSPDGAIWTKARHVISLGLQGQKAARELVEIRCERGAGIARVLGFSEATALAIRNLDEHWDGAGHPDGLKQDETPLLARICGLAQTLDVFYSRYGPVEAEAMVRNRRKRWFDPRLVDAFFAVTAERQFWETLGRADLPSVVSNLEPADLVLDATPDRLDAIASAFAEIIDAKSPYTSQHSTGVARVTTALASYMGFSDAEVREQTRGALLHDIGKLGVSNQILDKPGKLTDAEFAEIRKHPALTWETLRRVPLLAPLAEVAAAHHERLDGSGYFRGIPGSELTLPARILAVADVYDALASERPYRSALPLEEVLAIIQRDSGSKLCGDCVESLALLARSGQLAPESVDTVSSFPLAPTKQLDWTAAIAS